MKLVSTVYRISGTFPREEIYGLTSQVRRSAVSIPSNLAEGAARLGRKEFIKFVGISRGSLSELETQLLIAVNLNYMDKGHEVFSQIDEVSRLITGLYKQLCRD